MRLGFACVWDRNPRRTWSHTPWDLREALRRRSDVEVVDVGIELPSAVRRLLQLASLRRKSGRWTKAWEHLQPWEILLEAYLDAKSVALRCDAVLQIQDLGVTAAPYFVYQDLSYDVLLDLLEQGSEEFRRYFPHLDRQAILRRRERQLRIYRGAAGILTMSEFLKKSLISRTGLPPTKVHTVYPGAAPSAPSAEQGSSSSSIRTRTRPRNRLLFAGTSFSVKGGDIVVAAYTVIRTKNPNITLTVVGPALWPLPSAIPDGVRFLGRVDPAAMSSLYDEHDLLVMPSRMEGFGKVFVEALARGLPCIGRDDFAMPELVRPGENGGLITSDDPMELADCIAKVLADDGVYERCATESEEVMSRFNWDRAAAQIVATIKETLDIRKSATKPVHHA